jgi:hypothetical protein
MNKKTILQIMRSILLSAEEIQFAKAELEDGTIVKTEDDAIIVGSAIMVETPEGDVPAPDGEHKLKDGTIIKTEGGLVTEIMEPETVVEPEDEDMKKKEISMSDLVKKIEDIEAKLSLVEEKLSSELEKFKEASFKMAKELDELSNKPAVEPINLKKEVKSYEDMSAFERFMFEKEQKRK